MQSYIRTYYRLRKREPLIALGSHQGREGGGGALFSASAVPHHKGGEGELCYVNIETVHSAAVIVLFSMDA